MKSKYNSFTVEYGDKLFTGVFITDDKQSHFCVYAASFNNAGDVMNFLTRLLEYDDISFMRNIPISDKNLVDGYNNRTGLLYDQSDRSILSSRDSNIHVMPGHMSKETSDILSSYVMFKPTIAISLEELPPIR